MTETAITETAMTETVMIETSTKSGTGSGVRLGLGLALGAHGKCSLTEKEPLRPLRPWLRGPLPHKVTSL
eukprot:1154783-Pelagomonas_calceolata.AAC.3